EEARHTTNQSLLAGTVLAILVIGPIWYFSPALLRLMQLPTDAIAPAEVYLDYVVPVIPLIMIQVIGTACLRGAGDMVSGFLTMAIVNVVNITVGTCLVIGIGPFPNMGWEGLAIGTASGYVTGGLIILVLLLRGRAGLTIKRRLLRPCFSLISRILRIGIPGGADTLFVVFCHLWFLSVINSLGTLAAASHGIGVRIESLAYLPGSAFAVAATTLTGQFLGAGKPRRATRSALFACLVGGGVMVAAGFLFFFGAEMLTGIFSGEQTRLAADGAIPLLQLVAISMPSLALVIILNGALRGAGDTRVPLIFTVIGLVGIRIPLAYYLAWQELEIPWLGLQIHGQGMGLIGAWYAMIADVGLRSLLVVGRFWQGRWKEITV
ncbi:MAG: MATE family efflux transporter, partial [Planctomycetota bacterium]|nr:MATE family efflux transporter [Planctomycetota bacterium]